MIRVDNRRVVSSVAKTSYLANWKRNLLTIFAIVLTTFLLTSVLGIGIGYWKTIQKRSILMDGMDYDIELTEPRADQVKIVREMKQVKEAGIVVKCAIVKQYRGKNFEKLRFYWADNICFEKQCIPAFEFFKGAYPKQENEVVLSTSGLRAMRIARPRIGMTLPITYDSLKYGSKNEKLKKNFVLSGYYRDYTGDNRGYISQQFYKETGVKQTDLTQGSLKITLKNHLYSKQNILNMQKAINVTKNQIIMADDNTISNFLKMAATLIGVFVLILLSGYLFIYNALYISVSKDVRFYGQLKTIGMTSKQLKSLLYRQAGWNSLLGIPLGLALGAGVSLQLIPKTLLTMNPTLNAKTIQTFHPVIYFGTAIFACLTVLVSSRKPAVMAGECSPIEAIRYAAVESKARKDRTKEMKIRKREGGLVSMAWHNMFRNKKQAVCILLSFFVTLTIFVIINVVIRENGAKYILNQTYDYDIQIKNQTTLNADRKQLLTNKKVEQLKEIKGVKSIRTVTSEEIIVPYQDKVFGSFFKELYKTRYAPGNYKDDIRAYKRNASDTRFTSRLQGVDEKGFLLLNKRLGGILNEKDFMTGKVAVAIASPDCSTKGSVGKLVTFSIPEGINPKDKHSVKIAAAGELSDNPAYFAGGYTPPLVVSQNYIKKVVGSNFVELINVDFEKPFDALTEQKVKAMFGNNSKLSFDSKLDRYKEMIKTENQVKLLGIGLGLILALLAILNYINIMAADIQNRANEFATLESIGMTSKQIRKVLILEGVYYAVISMVLTVVCAVPLSYLVFQSMNRYDVAFSIPIILNAALFASVFLICSFIPNIIYRVTQRGSLIERMREI